MTKLLTVPEVAEMLAVEPSTIYSLIANDKIEGLAISPRNIRVELSEVERYIKSLKAKHSVTMKAINYLNEKQA